MGYTLLIEGREMSIIVQWGAAGNLQRPINLEYKTMVQSAQTVCTHGELTAVPSQRPRRSNLFKHTSFTTPDSLDTTATSNAHSFTVHMFFIVVLNSKKAITPTVQTYFITAQKVTTHAHTHVHAHTQTKRYLSM